MWDIERTDEFERRFKRYEKKHPRELTAVLANLNRLQAGLRAGANPRNLPFGFLHREQRGVLAVDQKGGGKSLAQTRLYLYLEIVDQVIHLITLGDKTTQKDDVKTAANYAEALNERKGRDDHGQG